MHCESETCACDTRFKQVYLRSISILAPQEVEESGSLILVHPPDIFLPEALANARASDTPASVLESRHSAGIKS